MAEPPDSARVLLITGASRGIGRGVALGAASRGDHLVLVARSRRALDDVAAECERAGATSVLVLALDVGDDAAVAECVAQAVARHGRIDGVVSCAGVAGYGRVEAVPAEVFDGIIRANLCGSANIARHVVPVLRRQRQGTLVFVGSVVGHIAVPSMTPYVVSKWGIRALARQVLLENRDVQRMHVCYVAPGSVATTIYDTAATYGGHAGLPPPPVASADRVARAVLGVLDRPRARVQVGIANNVMRVGFSALPPVFDRLVNPLFTAFVSRRARPSPDGPGNVLAPTGTSSAVSAEVVG